MTEIQRVMVNGRWPLNLPKHRAERESWPYWEATRLAAMHHFIEPGDVIYDIGAEAGDFSALFATWGARPVLIEPNPKAWPTIKAVWDANNLARPLWSMAMVSDHQNGDFFPDTDLYFQGFPCEVDNEIDPDHGFAHIGEDKYATTTLDALCDEWSYVDVFPDIITMDVEGGEGHVLRGAERTLTDIKPAVFASLHPQFMADLYGENVQEIHDLMKGYGYHGRFLCEDHEQHYVWTHPERRMFPGVLEDYPLAGDRVVL